eukprot:UN03752
MNMAHSNLSENILQVAAFGQLEHVCKPGYEIIGKLFKGNWIVYN